MKVNWSIFLIGKNPHCFHFTTIAEVFSQTPADGKKPIEMKNAGILLWNGLTVDMVKIIRNEMQMKSG